MTAEIITTARDRLDRVCFRHYGSVANGQVEAVLIANPGLERHPMLLPAGLKITMPQMGSAPPSRIIEQVQLWD